MTPVLTTDLTIDWPVCCWPCYYVRWLLLTRWWLRYSLIPIDIIHCYDRYLGGDYDPFTRCCWLIDVTLTVPVDHCWRTSHVRGWPTLDGYSVDYGVDYPWRYIDGPLLTAVHYLTLIVVDHWYHLFRRLVIDYDYRLPGLFVVIVVDWPDPAGYWQPCAIPLSIYDVTIAGCYYLGDYVHCDIVCCCWRYWWLTIVGVVVDQWHYDLTHDLHWHYQPHDEPIGDGCQYSTLTIIIGIYLFEDPVTDIILPMPLL